MKDKAVAKREKYITLGIICILCAAFLFGITYLLNDNNDVEPGNPTNSGKPVQGGVTPTQMPVSVEYTGLVYFPDVDYIYVEKESVSLKTEIQANSPENEVRAAKLKGLLNYLTNKPDITAIPKGSEVISVAVDGDKARIDYSEDFLNNQSQGSLTVKMCLAQIVWTCAQFDISEVHITINGENIYEYPGDVDISVPLPVENYRIFIRD